MEYHLSRQIGISALVNLKKSFLKDCFGWDVANWGRLIQFLDCYFSANEFSGKDLLELGCGCRNGGLSLWAAQKNARVVCSDYDFPSEETKKIHQKYSFSNLISYKTVDATAINSLNQFDFVVFKSVVGGIIRNSDSSTGYRLFSSIRDSLKVGGYACFAENLHSTWFHSLLRYLFGAGKNDWRYFLPGELEGLIHSVPGLKIMAKKNIGFLGAFGRSEFQRRLLGFVDRCLLEKIIPADYCYVGFFIVQREN